MLRIAETKFSKTSDLLKEAINTVEHYGFTPIEEILAPLKPIKKVKQALKISITHPEERQLNSLTKAFLEHGMHTTKVEPSLVYDVNLGSKSVSIGLHAVNNNDSFSEGTILATIDTLLKALGVSNAIIHINSIGDRESKQKFLRELNQYFRNNMNDIPAYARTDITAGNPLKALIKLTDKEHPIAIAAPNSMDTLNDDSRAKLREVLEYIESLGTDYELNPAIVGSSDCWSHVVFEVRVPQDGVYKRVVRGGRYNALARRAFNRKLPLAGAIIEFELKGATKVPKQKNQKPKFFMAHLGTEAKKDTLNLLSKLHSSKIRIAKTPHANTIAKQLADSEKIDASYLVIIGHKESLENSAIVRNTATRTQRTMPLSQVPGYLSRIKS